MKETKNATPTRKEVIPKMSIRSKICVALTLAATAFLASGCLVPGINTPLYL